MKNIFYLLVVLALVSCSNTKYLARVGHSFTFKEDHYTSVNKYQIYQVIDRTFYLAINRSVTPPSVIAISKVDDGNRFYEGEYLRGLYVMVNTYIYETKNDSVMCVPLLIPMKDYEETQYVERMYSSKRHRNSNKHK